jgi:hypothetical protein
VYKEVKMLEYLLLYEIVLLIIDLLKIEHHFVFSKILINLEDKYVDHNDEYLLEVQIKVLNNLIDIQCL